MDKDYSKRELDMKFKELETQIDENHTETLEKIAESDRRNHDKQETMLGMLGEINLKLLSNDKRTTSLEGWRTGIAMCIGLSIIVILPLIIYIFNTLSGQIQRNQQNIQSLQVKEQIK